jgi:hypothetical protein
MILRGNLRELPKKLRRLISPKRLLSKPRLLLKPTLVPVIFLLAFFLVAGFFAITQETGDADNPYRDDSQGDSLSAENDQEEIEPEFIPTSPPRWFRSNAGGMTLEEIPSRLGALRHEYALLIDYVTVDDMDPRLIPFYKDEYIIEIRVLYKEGKESRRQWLFRNADGNTRVNAVFRLIEDEPQPSAESVELEVPDEPKTEGTSALAGQETETMIPGGDASSKDDAASMGDADFPGLTLADTETPAPEAASGESAPSAEGAVAEGSPSLEGAASDTKKNETKARGGFIEVYNENGQISRDYSLFKDGSEILTAYFYNGSALIRAETQERDADNLEYRKTHTDNYRYNRSYSLRNVERVFHTAGIDPVYLVFPGRVIDAAYEKDFIKGKLTLASEFLGINQVDDGFRMVYDTDSKGRVLSETLYNGKDEVVWTLKNTWVGDRITAILKTEDGDESLIEYDYNASGDRIAERDIRNGVLERQVLIDGAKETEELYLNGVIVLKAFWEDGRKISEERVRRR